MACNPKFTLMAAGQNVASNNWFKYRCAVSARAVLAGGRGVCMAAAPGDRQGA